MIALITHDQLVGLYESRADVLEQIKKLEKLVSDIDAGVEGFQGFPAAQIHWQDNVTSDVRSRVEAEVRGVIRGMRIKKG